MSSLDTFPGGSNLDQDTVLVDTVLFVQLDENESLGNSSFSVERETSINFGRDTTRNDLQDLGTKVDQKLISSQVKLLLRRASKQTELN
jgi:hypothetical protein